MHYKFVIWQLLCQFPLYYLIAKIQLDGMIRRWYLSGMQTETQSPEKAEATAEYRVESSSPLYAGRNEIHTLKEWKRIYGYTQDHPWVKLVPTQSPKAGERTQCQTFHPFRVDSLQRDTTHCRDCGRTESEHSRTQHTPGPWIYQQEIDSRKRGYVRCSRRTNGGTAGIAVCRVSSTGIGASEVHANARLIAAAPAMFDVLERLSRSRLFSIDREANRTPGTEQTDLRDAIIAALFQAEGVKIQP